jgi:ABC-type multidrug transport system ATPase subunit
MVNVGGGVGLEIEGHGVGHRYAAARGLDPVDFRLEGPGLTAVTGANGTGKSTLLRILSGLLRPSTGRSLMRVQGREVPPAARRDVVGVAAPELQFYAEFTVRENLGFAAEARGLSDPAARVRAALDVVGLTPRIDDRANALSSGMRQRLRLAFALLGDPPVLLLDEPGSHLDDAGRDRLYDLMKRRSRETRVLVATNDPKEWTLAEQRITLTGRGLGDSP